MSVQVDEGFNLELFSFQTLKQIQGCVNGRVQILNDQQQKRSTFEGNRH